jgi:hypothetical protein
MAAELFEIVMTEYDAEQYKTCKEHSKRLDRITEEQLYEENKKLNSKIEKLKDERHKRETVLNNSTTTKDTSDLEKSCNSLKYQWEYQLKAPEAARMAAEKRIADLEAKIANERAKLELELLDIERKTIDRRLAYEHALEKLENAKKPNISKDNKIIIIDCEIGRLNDKITNNNTMLNRSDKALDKYNELVTKYKDDLSKCNTTALKKIIELVKNGSLVLNDGFTNNDILKWVSTFDKDDEDINENMRDQLITSDETDILYINDFKKVSNALLD